MISLCVILIILFSTSFFYAKCEDDKYLITLVYRFVFANEALCGDPFADPEWLPAAAECFVDCDPTIYMCMVHISTNIQKCKLLSKECQLGIRKHLGWSTSVVRVYRPPPRSSPRSRHSANAAIANDVQRNSDKDPISQKSDRPAVDGSANIERDLLGLSSMPASSVNQKSDDETLMANAKGLPARREWLEAPRIEENGYSIEDTSSFITETPLEDYNVLSGGPSQYEKKRANRFQSSVNDGESPRNERVPHTTEHTPLIFEYALPQPFAPVPPFPHVSAPQPPPPQPSPPAFHPFYAPQHPHDVMPLSPHNRNVLPTVIDFFEPFETSEELKTFTPGTVPRPPGFRPYDSNCGNNANNKTPGVTNTAKPFAPEDPPKVATSNNPPTQHYMQMRMVPYNEEIGFLDATANRGLNEVTSGVAARFEIEKGIAPLHPSVNVDFDKVTAVFPEKYHEHFIDSTSMRRVTAEVQPERARDYSSRCCEWSLNGLCDRHWQRVRKMCPKSCGSLVCEDIDGVKSCTRIVDVDVEDCFQAARLTRYFGLKVAETDEEKRDVIDGIVREKLNHINRTKRKLRKRRQ